VFLRLVDHGWRLKFLISITKNKNYYRGRRLIRNLWIDWHHQDLLLIVFDHTCLWIFVVTIFSLPSLVAHSPFHWLCFLLTKKDLENGKCTNHRDFHQYRGNLCRLALLIILNLN
jgi:hypothetical protein